MVYPTLLVLYDSTLTSKIPSFSFSFSYPLANRIGTRHAGGEQNNRPVDKHRIQRYFQPGVWYYSRTVATVTPTLTLTHPNMSAKADSARFMASSASPSLSNKRRAASNRRKGPVCIKCGDGGGGRCCCRRRLDGDDTPLPGCPPRQSEPDPAVVGVAILALSCTYISCYGEEGGGIIAHTEGRAKRWNVRSAQRWAGGTWRTCR